MKDPTIYISIAQGDDRLIIDGKLDLFNKFIKSLFKRDYEPEDGDKAVKKYSSLAFELSLCLRDEVKELQANDLQVSERTPEMLDQCNEIFGED